MTNEYSQNLATIPISNPSELQAKLQLPSYTTPDSILDLQNFR